MTGMTLFLIVLTFFLAFALSYFWYKGKRSMGRLFWVLFAIRGLALWMLAILLINPLFQKYSYYTEKPGLNILVDNSRSITQFGTTDDIAEVLGSLRENDRLKEQFELNFFRFGEEVGMLNAPPSFDEGRTDIASAFRQLRKLGYDAKNPSLLISDGNSTYGADYQYNAYGWSGPVFTVAAGDTTQYSDLVVDRVNVNRYAYANNRFPVEVFAAVEGYENVETALEVWSEDRRLFKRNIRIDAIDPVVAHQIELEAGAPGLKRFYVLLQPLEGEKNTTNNRYDFAVEVLGQRNRIGIVAGGPHPDIGVLVKMLEREGQREVEVLKPAQTGEIQNYDLILLFSPDRSFSELFELLDRAKKNYFILGGEGTDWNSVNNLQDLFTREITYNTELVQGRINPGFSEFRFDAPEISGAPPVTSLLGDFIINAPYEVLLSKSINGIETQRPLLFTVERSGRRVAVLDGSGLWKWRLWYYTQNEDFTGFDTFWSTLIRYLLTGVQKDRLSVSYEAFYQANTQVNISAGYYDKNFAFDPSENLEISIKHEDSLQPRAVSMIPEEREYTVRFNRLLPGAYDFDITAPAQGLKVSGQFTVLEYDLEKQFANTDTRRLKALAARTGGRFITLDSVPGLIEDLLQAPQFKPVQKQKRETVSLVDWPALLFGICLLFGCEWLIRKYNGLI